MPLRVIVKAEFERSVQHADHVVVGLLAPIGLVRDLDECRMPNIEESVVADLRAPNLRSGHSHTDTLHHELDTIWRGSHNYE